MRAIKSAVLSLVLVGVGCARSSSLDIRPSAFYGTLQLRGDSTNTVTCSATWQVGGPTGTYIDLDGGDKTTCSDGTTEVVLGKDTSIIGSVTYRSTAVPYGAGKTYTITLTTGGESFASTVILPEAVSVAAPSNGQTVVKGTALPITWNAGSGNSVNLRLAWTIGINSGSSSESSADSGSYTAPTTFTQTPEPGLSAPITGNAAATLTLTRSREGSFAASGLEGGTISASQFREVILILTD